MQLRFVLLTLLVCAGPGCSSRSLDGLSRDFRTDVMRPGETPPDAVADTGSEPTIEGPAPDAGAALAPEDTAGPIEVRAEAAAPEAGPVDGAEGKDTGAPAQKVALVVATIPLSNDDQAIARRLGERGLGVEPCADDEVASCDVSRVALVFISPSSLSTKVGTTFRTLGKPVIVSDAPLFDDMGMVQDDASADPNQHGNEDVVSLDVDAKISALNAGLGGVVTIAPAPVSVNWASPPDSAIRAARVVGRPERVVLFGYLAGSMMSGLAAPARRVGLFLGEDAAAKVTEAAWKLVDAAVAWSLQ
jgi:hypothetical protein